MKHPRRSFLEHAAIVGTTPANADVQAMRVELFAAEKRVRDLREQLKQAGDGAFVAHHDRELNGQNEPEGF